MIIQDIPSALLMDQLADERQLLRILIDSLPDGVYIKDKQSRFVIANLTVAHLMGVSSPDELIGKTDFDFFSYDLAAKYYEDEQTVIRTGQALVNQEELTFDYRTGKNGWLLTSKVVWRNRNGGIDGVLGIGRNITELKQAQDALIQAQRELEHRVEDRTLELEHSKAKLERILDVYRSTLNYIGSIIRQTGVKTELLMYLEQAQKQFDRLG